MKIVYTKHAAVDKFIVLKKLGWKITRAKIESTLQKPKWRGVSRHGQETAMRLVDAKHIIRVILIEEMIQ